MHEQHSPTERIARQQIAERVATASSQRLATYLPSSRRRRFGRTARRGDPLGD